MRQRRIKTNPAAQVLLPAARPSKPRKSFTIEQAQRLLVDAIPSDSRPAMWLTGLMCGLRPGELAGLRWCFVDVDSDSPSIEVAERALERAVDAAEKAGREDAEASAAFRTVASKLLPDLFPDQ